MNNITIDDASLHDIPVMLQLLNTLFSIEQDFKPETQRQIAGLTSIIQAPDSAKIKVARNNLGEVIGMVSAQLVISTAQGSRSAWIEDMVIHEDYRSRGIGRRLLDAILAWSISQGATRAQLLVDLDNHEAIGYYDHLGWQSSRMGMRRLLLAD